MQTWVGGFGGSTNLSQKIMSNLSQEIK